MTNKKLRINSLIDGLIRCMLTCLLNDYIGSIYCVSFTSTKQYYQTSALFACVAFIFHFIFAAKEKSRKRTVEFSWFSILWCNLFKTIMLILRLFVAISLFPQKEKFYGEAFEQIVILGISHALFAILVLLMWLVLFVHSKLTKKES